MSETQLELQIISNANAAVGALNQLETALRRVQTAVSNGFDNSAAIRSIQNFSEALRNAVPEDSIARIERISIAMAGLRDAMGTRIDTSAVTDMATRVEETRTAVEGIRDATRTATEAVTRYGRAMRDVGAATDTARGGVDAVNNSLRNTAGRTMEIIPGLRNLLHMFVRIATYRLIRTALRAIVQAFRTGLTNVREYSRAIGSEYATAMDTAAAATLQMQNSLGAALAPAVQSLIPLFQTLVNWVIAAANALNQFFSLLGGATSWTRAKTIATSSMEQVQKSAGGAAKEIKNLLASWDELNIIQSESGGGGGGGGASAVADYADMFEEVTQFDERIQYVVGWITDHMQEIRDVAISVGAALLTWRIVTAFQNGLLLTLARIAGIAIAVYGAIVALRAFRDQWDNGINFDNMTTIIGGLAAAVVGLGIAFGAGAAGAALFLGGLLLVVNPLRELLETGNLTNEAMLQLVAGVGAVAGGITMLVTGSIGAAIRIMLGFAIATFGAVYMFNSFRDQWENGINMENFTTAMEGAIALIVGLGIAFGIAGIGWGALIAGVVLVINPLKELIETGTLAGESLLQLAIGVGFIGGAIALLVTRSIPYAIRMFLGLALTVYGIVVAYNALVDQFENGINWENFTNLVLGAIAAVAGLTIAFGANGFALGMVAAGIAMVAEPVAELLRDANSLEEVITNLQNMSDPAFLQLETGIMAVGIGLTALTGSWIPVAIAGLADVVLAVVRNWEDIQYAWDMTWETMRQAANNAIEGIIDFVTPGLNWLIGLVNTFLTGINALLSAVGVQIDLIPEIDAQQWKRDLGLIEFDTDEFIDEEEVNKQLAEAAGYVYDSWQEALEDYKPEEVGGAEYFWELAVDPLLKDISTKSGLTDEAAKEVSDKFFEAWQDTYNAENKAEARKVLPEILRETIFDYGGFMPINPEDFQDSDLADQAERVVVDALQDLPEGLVAPEWKLPIGLEFETVKEDIEEPVRDIYQEIYDAMNNYDPEGDIPLLTFLNDIFRPLLDEAVSMNGITGDAAQSIVDRVYNKWLQYLFDDEFEGDINGIINILHNLIEEENLPAPDNSAIEDGFANTATSIEESTTRIRNAVASLNGLSFSFMGGLMGGTFTVNLPAMAAEGGMFTTGQMFIAREAGPEMVGQMNGKTTVANNDQIVTGISSGVAAGQSEQNALLRQQNDYLRRLLGKEFVAKVEPSAKLGRTIRQSEEMYARNTGVNG